MNAVALAVCLLLMLGSFLGIRAVDRRAIPPVLATAALLVCAAAVTAGLLTL